MKVKFHLCKKLLFASIILFYCPSIFSQSSLIGKWADADHKEKQIDIYTEKNNKLYGKSEKGFIVLKDFVYNFNSHTYNGTLVNPDDNEEFIITIKQPTVNRFTFSVRKFIFSKRFTFEKQSTK